MLGLAFIRTAFSAWEMSTEHGTQEFLPLIAGGAQAAKLSWLCLASWGGAGGCLGLRWSHNRVTGPVAKAKRSQEVGFLSSLAPSVGWGSASHTAYCEPWKPHPHPGPGQHWPGLFLSGGGKLSPSHSGSAPWPLFFFLKRTLSMFAMTLWLEF